MKDFTIFMIFVFLTIGLLNFVYADSFKGDSFGTPINPISISTEGISSYSNIALTNQSNNFIGNGNFSGNLTANVYHGLIDWVYTIIGMSGNFACDNLDNKVLGYSYTCQTVIDTSGSTVGCGTTLVTLNAQAGCKID